MEPAAVEAAKSAPMESATVESTKPAASVETTAAAMRPSIGEVWLAERGRAQQRSSNCQSSSVLRPRFMFA